MNKGGAPMGNSNTKAHGSGGAPKGNRATKKEMQVFSIKVSHPDPLEEAKAAKTFVKFAKALGEIMGEEVKILEVKKND